MTFYYAAQCHFVVQCPEIGQSLRHCGTLHRTTTGQFPAWNVLRQRLLPGSKVSCRNLFTGTVILILKNKCYTTFLPLTIPMINNLP